MLLIYNNPDAMQNMSTSQQNEVMAEVGVIMDELTESGDLVGGEPLAHPALAKTVRVVDGALVATDGPFSEAKELLAGYISVEVANL